MAATGPYAVNCNAIFPDIITPSGDPFRWANPSLAQGSVKIVESGSRYSRATAEVKQTTVTLNGITYKFDHWKYERGPIPPGFTDGSTSTKVTSEDFEATYDILWYAAIYLTETYDITTEADPANAGTTTGDGSYAMGASCSIGVTPNPGYNFIKWTSDKSRVGKHKSHTFDVIGDEKWTAHLVVSDGSIICRQSNNLILDDNGILCI